MLQSAVEQVASQLNSDYTYRNTEFSPLILVVLNGAIMFASDVIRRLTFTHQMECICLSSYKDNKRGVLEWKLAPSLPTKGRKVIIIEDIVDSGSTIKAIKALLEEPEHEPDDIRVVSLFTREGCEEHVDYTCIQLGEGLYAYGYGLDDNGYNRNSQDVKFLIQ